MEFLEWYLSVLSQGAEWFGIDEMEGPFSRFFLSLFTTVLVVAAVLLIIHLLFQGLAHGIEYLAQSLARGARSDTIKLIERYSSSAVTIMHRIAFAQLKRSYSSENHRLERLPSASQSAGGKILRSIFRGGLHVTSAMISTLSFVGAGVFTVTGLGVLVLALSIAFPEIIRTTVSSVAEGIRSLFTMTISPGALLAAVGAAITVALIVVKILRSERANASRRFLQQRDDEAIHMLHEFIPIAANLAAALNEHIDRTAQLYTIQRRLLSTWQGNIAKDKTNRISAQRSSMHTECDHTCLQQHETDKPDAVYSPDLQQALEDYHRATSLRRKMAERRAEFARLFTARAWEWYVYFVIFRPSMGSYWSSTKRQFRLPGDNEWYEMRVRYQHDKLRELSKADAKATYEFDDIELRLDEVQLCEDQLFNDMWEMCKAHRQLTQLIKFGDRLFRKTPAGTVLNRAVS